MIFERKAARLEYLYESSRKRDIGDLLLDMAGQIDTITASLAQADLATEIRSAPVPGQLMGMELFMDTVHSRKYASDIDEDLILRARNYIRRLSEEFPEGDVGEIRMVLSGQMNEKLQAFYKEYPEVSKKQDDQYTRIQLLYPYFAYNWALATNDEDREAIMRVIEAIPAERNGRSPLGSNETVRLAIPTSAFMELYPDHEDGYFLLKEVYPSVFHLVQAYNEGTLEADITSFAGGDMVEHVLERLLALEVITPPPVT